jgi:hypothetical protein
LLEDPADIVCINDPYGELPALIKIAMFVDLLEPALASFFVIRRLSMGRMLYIFNILPMLDPILAVVAPIFDIVKVRGMS